MANALFLLFSQDKNDGNLAKIRTGPSFILALYKDGIFCYQLNQPI